MKSLVYYICRDVGISEKPDPETEHSTDMLVLLKS